MQPDAGTFPEASRLHELAYHCRALPCAAWLDGSSEGEQSMEELLTLLVGQGVAALNIVPERNWNFADRAVAAAKQAKLYEVVALARAFDLPLDIGTEMNSFGQPFVDNFAAPALAPVREAFLDEEPILSTATRCSNAGWRLGYPKRLGSRPPAHPRQPKPLLYGCWTLYAARLPWPRPAGQPPCGDDTR
jgi:hypothetical protein